MTSDSEFNNSTVFVGTPQGVSQSGPRARLVCLDDTGDENLKNFEIFLIQSEKMLGRSAENPICIPHKRLSRRHARLFLEGTTWTVEDLNSTNGVFVNEKKVSRAQLNDGDIVKFGPLPFRYELEESRPVSDTTDAEASSPLGVEGTLYAGHAEVLASLAAAEKDVEPSEEPPTERPPIAKKSPSGQEKRSSARKPILRYLLILFIGLGLAGAGYLYVNHQRQQELNQLVKDYESRLQKFLEEYEGGSDASFQSIQAEEELEEIRTLKAGVDFAANQYPQSLAFKELQAKLLFLEFERRFQNLLLIEQSIYDARSLVDKTRDEIGALLPRSASTTKSAIVEVLELLDLANVVVRFRQFSQRFNNFSDQVGDPFERGIVPTRAELREMQDLKAQFIEKKKANRLPLSVTYTEFQSLLEEVEKQDIHFVDRLRGLMRRQQQ